MMGPERGSEYVDKSYKLLQPPGSHSHVKGGPGLLTPHIRAEVSKVQNILNPLEENRDIEIMSHSEMFLLQMGIP